MPWTRHSSPGAGTAWVCAGSLAPLSWTLLSMQELLALLLVVTAATGQVPPLPPLPWGRSNTSAALPVSLGSSTQGGRAGPCLGAHRPPRGAVMARDSEQRGSEGSQPTGMGSGLRPARDTPQQWEGGPEPPSPALGWPLRPHHVLLAPGSFAEPACGSPVSGPRPSSPQVLGLGPAGGTGVPCRVSLGCCLCPGWRRGGGRGRSPVPGPPAASPLPCPTPQPVGGDFTTSIRVSSPLRPSGVAGGGVPPWLAGHPWVLSLAQTVGAAGEAASAGRAPAGSPQLPQPGPRGPGPPGSSLQHEAGGPTATSQLLPQCHRGCGFTPVVSAGQGAEAGGCGGLQGLAVLQCGVSWGGAPSLSPGRAPKASGRGRAPWGQGQSLSCHRQGHGQQTPSPRACVTWGAGAGCWGASAPLIPGGQGWVPRGIPRHLPPPLPGC